MGTHCAKPHSSTRSNSAEISDSFLKEHYQKPTNAEYFFSIKLLNLCLSCQLDEIYQIVFEINQKVKALFPSQDLYFTGKLKMWHTVRHLQLKLTYAQLKQSELNLKVYSKSKRKIETLTLKFDELCRGPIHHDHLLPEMKSRVVFDIEINQFVNIDLTCTEFHIHERQKQITDIQLKVSLDLIVTESNQTKEDFHKILKHPIGQSIKFSKRLLSSQLKQSSLRLIIWNQKHNGLRMLGQVYIPYQKLVNLCGSYLTQCKNNIYFVKRNVNLKELLKKENLINCQAPTLQDKHAIEKEDDTKIQFSLCWQVTQTYAEQLEGVICSQKGIGTVSPHLLTGQGGYSVFAKTAAHNQLDYKQLKTILKQYKQLKSKKNLYLHKKILVKTYQGLTKAYQMDLDDEYQAIDYQFLLLDIMQQISSFIEDGQESINENIWKIFGIIIRRPELSIRYFHAIDNIHDKKRIGIKFYKFLCSVLCIVVRSTAIGLTFSELKYSQKFIAYCYFRYPFIQRAFINDIYKNNRVHLSQDKLDELGACVGIKSPSKSMVFDWESNFYNFVRKQPEQIEIESKLKQIIESLPEWSIMLFNYGDEQLYFGGLTQLINQAEQTLLYQGKIMWEYFPGYSNILSCLQSQMQSNQPIGFTQYFRDFAVKLMRNQKLINTFMKYLFSKTFLFQTYSVMRCIDIIRSCFEGITIRNNHKLPTNFNYTLFYQGIVSILEINHSYLVIKTLNILYSYYDMLSLQCQNNIDVFVMGSNFYQLFFHWYHLARKIFMCFLRKHVIPKYIAYEKQLKSGKEEKIPEGIRQNIYCYREFMVKIDQKEKQQINFQQRIKFPKLADQYYLKMKEKMMNHKKNDYPLFNGTQIFQNKKRSHRLTVTCPIKKKQIQNHRPRKWSNSYINEHSFDRLTEYQPYIQNALSEYRLICASKQSMDKIYEKILSQFCTKKKVDENDDKT